MSQKYKNSFCIRAKPFVAWAFFSLCFSMGPAGAVSAPHQGQGSIDITRDFSAGRSFFRSHAGSDSYKTGEFLILQSSDQHSAYHKMPNFLASIEVLSRNFKEQNPNGQVILIFNGDFSALDSYWSKQDPQDKGNFGYRILSRLAEKYHVFYVFGNHDAFDWEDGRLFLDQMRTLKNAGVHLLAGNIAAAPEYEGYFTPFVDVPNSNGGLLRFAGFTIIKDREKRLNLKGPRVLLDIYEINQSLSAIIKSANKNPQVERLIPIFHLGAGKTEGIVSRLRDSQRQKLNVVFSAHDHRQTLIWTNGVYIVDSDSHFQFSEVVLDSSGRFVFRGFFNAPRQKQFLKLYPIDPQSLEARLIQDVRAWLSQFPPYKKARKKRRKKLKPHKQAAMSHLGKQKQGKGRLSPSAERDLCRDGVRNAAPR